MPHHNIEKLLIANRGEIALRVQRAAKKLGIKTVSIASEADKDALFARNAEELIVIGAAAPKDSYLNIQKILAAAKSSGAHAIHPGYGFLSENADFAKSVLEAGLIFVGPSPESIALMGHKTRAKETVQAHGVPCAPSSASGLSDTELIRASKKVGFPLLIKAVAGGGGRGMRIIQSPDELEPNLPRARSEALKNFGNEDVFLERYIEKPRHVEVQVFGDEYGNIIHLGTRDCSTQRRHQKIIEEAPAPDLSTKLRQAIHQAAIKAAQSVSYKNAGTIEFLVKDEDFYFLEMNTRIQVEHPVTEMITGVDLVELQLKVARGEKLPLTQKEVQFKGHAIEFRINAEDPFNKFSPASGKITKLTRPTPAEGIREDFGYEEGDSIPLFYDSLVSKLIVQAPSRAQAILKSREVLNTYLLEGVPTSIDYQRWLLYNLVFSEGPVDIGFVEREFPNVRDLKALRLKDPKWQKALGGAEVKNLFEYTSKKYNTTYTIEVLHKRDGFFVVGPIDREGKRAKTQNCRHSNGLDDAIQQLIEDVLEKTPPAEIF